ncbi:hypothetical protein WN66_04460 [Saccharomyces cerevisiae]|nr:hypothetical protein WN66_04460 [Saccharomyces cerevisiae]
MECFPSFSFSGFSCFSLFLDNGDEDRSDNWIFFNDIDFCKSGFEYELKHRKHNNEPCRRILVLKHRSGNVRINRIISLLDVQSLHIYTNLFHSSFIDKVTIHLTKQYIFPGLP